MPKYHYTLTKPNIGILDFAFNAWADESMCFVQILIHPCSSQWWDIMSK